MALQKTYVTPKGEASYWIAGLIQIDNYNKSAYGKLYGFVSKEHCDREGSVPVMYLEYNITPDVYDYYFDKEIMILPNVTPQSQFYQITKDFNRFDEQNNIINFKDALEVY